MSSNDAANVCLPPKHPVTHLIPPLPTTERGDRCPIAVQGSTILYASNKNVVVRQLQDDLPLIYRGHAATVTAVSSAKSGYYAATGDQKGALKVWALDHEEHRAKYATQGLSGPVRDIQWDADNKRVAFCGERAPNDPNSANSKVVSWDTGNSLGNLGLHLKGRATSLSFKPNRPYRLVSSGKDDSKVLFHSGPPFQKVVPKDNVPCEAAHVKGAVHCVRYNADGSLVASVGSDKSITVYDGKTLQKLHRFEDIHTATIYCVAWKDNDTLLTGSGDGTCKLWKYVNGSLDSIKIWDVAEFQHKSKLTKLPLGGAQVGCGFVGDTLLAVSANGQICLLGDTITVWTGHTAPMAAACHAGDYFYTADTDGVVVVWDWPTMTPKSRLAKSDNSDLMYVLHKGAVSDLVVANGKLLSVGWDDFLYTTEGATVDENPQKLVGQPVAIAVGTSVACIATVNGLQLVVDGKVGEVVATSCEANAVQVTSNDLTVYVGGKDCKIYVYNISGESLEQTGVLEGHRKCIHSLSLSNSEKFLASGDEKDICVWDLEAKKTVVSPGQWCFHGQRITSLAWTPDDLYLVSGGADDSIYVWNPKRKMKRLHFPFAHRGGIVHLEVRNKYELISAGVDSVVQVWNLEADIQAKFG